MNIDASLAQETPEDRARHRIIGALSLLKGKNLKTMVQDHADEDVAFFSMFVGKDGNSVDVIVDGRHIWNDLTITFTKESFSSSDEEELQLRTEARDVWLELIKLALSLPPAVEEVPSFYLLPFQIWNDEDEVPLWQQVLDHWMQE